MKVFIAFETNIWGGDDTYVCTASTIDECVTLIKKNNTDLIKNVIAKQSHIVVNKVIVGEYESETQVINTSNEDDYNLFIDVDKYIKEIVDELKRKELFLIKIERERKQLELSCSCDDYEKLSDLQDRLVWAYSEFIESTAIYDNISEDDVSRLFIDFN